MPSAKIMNIPELSDSVNSRLGRIVVWGKYRYCNLLDPIDVESELYMGVVHAMRSYDASKGASLETWITYNAKWYIQRLAGNEARRKKREYKLAKGIFRKKLTREQRIARQSAYVKQKSSSRRSAFLKDKCCEICGASSDLVIVNTRGMGEGMRSLWTATESKRKLYLQYSIIMCKEHYYDYCYPDRNKHGRESTYINKGCRCEKCRAAHSAVESDRWRNRRGRSNGKTADC